MKALKMMCVIVAVLMLLAKSAILTGAACLDTILGRKDGTYVSCTLTGEDSQWCYYDCTCSGDLSNCDKVYDQLGLIDN
ncbi:MAG: hypothetical protein U0Z53_19010 [Blastocatellia bacterium]